MDKDKNSSDEQQKQLGDRIDPMQMPIDTKGRIITIVVLAIILITIWFMLDIVIVTFVLTFVFYQLQKYSIKGLSKTPIKIPDGIVLLIIYVIVIGLFVAFAVQNTPIIFRQITAIAGAFVNFDFNKFLAEIDPSLKQLAFQIDVNAYVAKVGQFIMDWLKGFGTTALNTFLALLMSFLFVLEKKKILAIGDTVMSSRIAVIYRYFVLFGSSFWHTFGKVMKVQVIIAAINCAISMICLTVAGFPYILVLGIMIFVLGLIPVAGVFISLIPLTIIAFNVGGLQKVIMILIMIAVIHVIEAYFLNPKLMSRRTSLPISVVFVVLIISERYLGMWGMLIGVPIFIYVMNVLNIDYRKAMAVVAEKERKNDDAEKSGAAAREGKAKGATRGRFGKKSRE